ncbi:MAG: hypothetical protein LBV23_08130 [Deltaproteobacteria bacterium]|jgi:3-oxoacyl-(acyl-carrier-protein) synthase|nr:hypothetical protein [Deltaproteobacteria bacterium]
MPKSCELFALGAGLITPFGDLLATIRALLKGQRVQSTTLKLLEGSPLANRLAAVRTDINLPTDPFFRKMRKYMSRQSLLAALAAREAMSTVNPFKRGFDPNRTGLYAAVGLAAVDQKAALEVLEASLGKEYNFDSELFFNKALRLVNPLWAFETLANMPACVVSVLEGIKGESAIYSPFEDGAAQALCEAAECLERGEVDLAVVVASDSPDEPSNLAQISLLGYLGDDETACGAGAALILTNRKGLDKAFAPRLSNFSLYRAPISEGPRDPLSLILGRTMAAAPLVLAVLATEAPELKLETNMVCSQGHTFSFRVNLN